MESGNFTHVVDPVFIFVLVVSIILLVGITITMLYFLYRYNKKRNPKATDIHGHAGLEIIWTIVPLILVSFMFYFGWVGFKKMANPPENSINIDVTARMWSWLFEYETGLQTDTLYVPVNKAIKLTLNSSDVIHSFYVPAFRIKKDVVPGKLRNTVWFAADEPGRYDLFCAEYCGERHSYMLSKVVAMPQAEYDTWLADASAGIPQKTASTEEEVESNVSAKRGEMLVKTKGGCIACHSFDGSRLVGPSFKGIFGRNETVIVNDEEMEIVIDEDYLRESMLKPNARVVKGYPAVMPPAPLAEDEIEEVIAYLKELK